MFRLRALTRSRNRFSSSVSESLPVRAIFSRIWSRRSSSLARSSASRWSFLARRACRQRVSQPTYFGRGGGSSSFSRLV
jgi:hypothetical protein